MPKGCNKRWKWDNSSQQETNLISILLQTLAHPVQTHKLVVALNFSNYLEGNEIIQKLSIPFYNKKIHL